MTQRPGPTPFDVGVLVRDAGDAIAGEHDLAAGTATLRHNLAVDRRRDPTPAGTPLWRRPLVLGAAAAVAVLAVLVWAMGRPSTGQSAPPAHPPSPSPSSTVVTPLPMGVWSGTFPRRQGDIAAGSTFLLRVRADGTGQLVEGYVVPIAIEPHAPGEVTLVDLGHVDGRDQTAQCHGAIATYRVTTVSADALRLTMLAQGPCGSMDTSVALNGMTFTQVTASG